MMILVMVEENLKENVFLDDFQKEGGTYQSIK